MTILGVHLKRVIPCLDVDAGRVVKGTNFVDLRDAGRSGGAGRALRPEGADELVFLDITATHEQARHDRRRSRGGRPTTSSCRSRSAAGIRSVADAQAVLDAGADKVSVNSAAVARPELDRRAGRACSGRSASCWPSTRKGAAATRGRPLGWEVFVAGGRTPTGRDAVAWAREGVERGAGEILLTSMDRDGTERRLRPRADARGRRGGRRARSSPPAAPGSSSTSSTALEAGADAALCASIFHYGRLPRGGGQGAPFRRRRGGPRLTASACGRSARRVSSS